jgi:hypothetical protein
MGTMGRVSVSNPRTARTGDGKVYRGSNKRVRRIKWQANTPVRLRILVALLIVALAAMMSWLIRHPPHHPRQHDGAYNPGRAH